MAAKRNIAAKFIGLLFIYSRGAGAHPVPYPGFGRGDRTLCSTRCEEANFLIAFCG